MFRPQFSIDDTQIEGINLGRLYLPTGTTPLPVFHNPVYEIRRKTYPDGQKVIWIIASRREYRRLAKLFPHEKPYLRKRTYSLLEI